MNEYMNRVASETFSYFDTEGRASGKSEPERFYRGFVLGLMVGLKDRYVITSNRESGFGRYDIMLEPKVGGLDAFVIEFKVYNLKRDAASEDTVKEAHTQIEEMGYAAGLTEKGIWMCRKKLDGRFLFWVVSLYFSSNTCIKCRLSQK